MSTSKKKSSPSNGGGGLKQGTLFSFFSKKPKSPSGNNNNSSSSSSSSNNSNNNNTASSKTLRKFTSSSLNNKASSTATSFKTKSKLTTPNVSKTTQSSSSLSSGKEELLALLKVGSYISVYWSDDGEYYKAKIASKTKHANDNDSDHVYTLVYDDGEIEKNVDLQKEDFKMVKGNDKSVTTASTSHEYKKTEKKMSSDTSGIVSQEEENGDYDEEEEDDQGPVSNNNSRKNNRAVKKRKIIEESDEEAEFDDEEEAGDHSDASEFIADSEEEEDDPDVDMERTDDEADDNCYDDKDAISSPKPISKKKRGFQVTTLKAGSESNKRTNIRGGASFITPPPKKKKTSSTSSNLNSFASFASGSSREKASNEGASLMNTVREITPLVDLRSPLSSCKKSSHSAGNVKTPLPQQGIVNQAGTHYHNHYAFLQPHKRRDGKNRLISDPDYDHRTLKVDYKELEKVSKKVTPAQQQWWEMKARYADTVLLFKTGKFYEIFHMDADVAVQVMGFNYMKGQDAHAGFPEIAYGNFCERFVKAGYKVARIEQTETPEMLNQRKKRTKVGQKPKVVNRELCSIVTAGTRTFCYMDDVRGLEQISESGGKGIGPLLAIKEIPVTCEENDPDQVQPVCEYGITIVDAATGEITLGQFADDILRSRMNTLLTKYSPSEILVESGTNGVSDTLLSLINSVKKSILPNCQVEKVSSIEFFPKSTALDKTVRIMMERPTTEVKPWDNDQTLQELHRRGYFPRASRKKNDFQADPKNGVSRWPEVLKACIEGDAELALSSLGAALFYLQRNLIDQEILSMGIMKGYIPPEPARNTEQIAKSNSHSTNQLLKQIVINEERQEDGIHNATSQKMAMSEASVSPIQFPSIEHDCSNENLIDHLSLDGTTIANLEILANLHSNTAVGSLWSKLNFTKNPGGSRLLRAWLLRPLFRKEDIDRRADAVEELISGGAAAAMSEARVVLGKCGDMERLLSRVHSMGYSGNSEETCHHPNERAIYYEMVTHTKRKVGDFSKLLAGLQAISRIPEIFEGVDIRSPLLGRIVRRKDDGGLFPSNLIEELDWFANNFDCKKAAAGSFEPCRGVDEEYDVACDLIERIKKDLEHYKNDVCENEMTPRAKSQWKYANTKVDSKDKYLIELPASVQVPCDFMMKGKRGKGPKQVNKYRTPIVEELVSELEHAYDVLKEGKARGIRLIFAKFDSLRSLWSAASHASAMLDALGALAQASSTGGCCRPIIQDCGVDDEPFIMVKQGRHPCVDFTHTGGDFIPNNLNLGNVSGVSDRSRVLLLSGPNMGGKSTLLRQTCLIAILAQIGCFVPADQCILTPFDRIFTRLGASDRILQGQSTFFVELAETAAALRGATRRSLCIFDELGRGTSTFDGTAIASASVKHLVEKNQCLALFATHYHSLLDEWKSQPTVRLGHMECFVEEGEDGSNANKDRDNITFLYTLGEGSCPKSFGINVARLAGLPSDVLTTARAVSASFEESIQECNMDLTMGESDVTSLKQKLLSAVKDDNVEAVHEIWKQLQCKRT